MADEFHFHKSARRRSSIVIISAIWIALLGLNVFLDARIWILAIFALFTLPAIFDIAKGRESKLHIDDRIVEWSPGSGKDGSALLANILQVGVRIRLDFSRRIRFDMRDGTVLRLPPDCTPPGNALEAAFAERQIPIRREYFG